MNENRGLWRGKTTPKSNGEAFNNIWVEGDLIHSVDLCYIHPITNHVKVQVELGRFIVMHEVDPSTLGECTGLRDMNGKLIFEGDICKDESGSTYLIVWRMHQWQCKVIHSDCVLALDCSFPLWQWDNCMENGYRTLEIIGNIHDNPELLERR